MHTKHILHIEDDPANQMLIKLYLKNEPYKMTAVESPDKALETLKAESVDIIIMDLNLREQGDGAVLVRAVRELPGYESVPIFVFSGFDEHHLKEHGIDNLIQKFFPKPTLKNTLIEALREYLPHDPL